MTIDLHPDDEDLLGKLRAIPPEDREAVLVQLHREDWKPDRRWQTVHEWLVLSMRLEHSLRDLRHQRDLQLAIQLGEVTERLRWVAHRAPITRATPETLAVGRQKQRVALLKDSNGRRRDDNTYRHHTAEEWRSIARDIASRWKKHKFGGKRIEVVINDALKRQGLEHKAPSTIRKAIRGLKRPI